MTLREVIALTFAYYNRGQTLSDAVLEMYAGDLSDQDQLKCMAAYAQWRRNPANKTFPLPAQIIELINPDQFVAPETKAREVAARVIGAISKFGWTNAKGAQVFIGPEGWGAVNRMGGWSYLCENVGPRGINPASLQAQLRDLLMGDFKHGAAVIEQSIGALTHINNRTGELEPAGNVLALVTGKRDDDKEPA
jgi:hypothetical protein